jgi:hypothetical protein
LITLIAAPRWKVAPGQDLLDEAFAQKPRCSLLCGGALEILGQSNGAVRALRGGREHSELGVGKRGHWGDLLRGSRRDHRGAPTA